MHAAHRHAFGPLVNVPWLSRNLGKVVVADCRWSLKTGPMRAAFLESRIPTARFVDLDAQLSAPASKEHGRHPLPSPDAFAKAMVDVGISNGDTVVAYDDAGGVIAARFWFMLDAIGNPAAVLDGGFAAWVKAGEKVESSSPASFAKGKFHTVPWPKNRIVSANDVSTRSAHSVLMDARSNERFLRGDPAVDPRPGHIPGAINCPSGSLIGADGVFKPASELVKLVDKGKGEEDVIAYCGSGVTACSILLARRIAGLPDGKLYVGSWSQWGNNLALPAETEMKSM